MTFAITDGILYHISMTFASAEAILVAPDQSNERAIFEAQLDQWVKAGHVGHVVVIKGCDVLGIFKTEAEACRVILDRHGQIEFFMSLILPRDSVSMTSFGKVK